MRKGLKLGSFEIFWLDGGIFELDGGCMFGVVPRALWKKKFPSSDDDHIKLVNSPILVKTPAGNVIIDSGLGNKLTDKQKKSPHALNATGATQSLPSQTPAPPQPSAIHSAPGSGNRVLLPSVMKEVSKSILSLAEKSFS